MNDANATRAAPGEDFIFGGAVSSNRNALLRAVALSTRMDTYRRPGNAHTHQPVPRTPAWPDIS